MATCNLYDVTADKIVIEGGTKYTSSLSGQKEIDDLIGDADKSTTLIGQKFISDLAGDTGVTLYGDTIIISLSGTTLGDTLLGATDKFINLLGGACEARFHVLVDTTYVTVDNTLITVDDDAYA